MVDIDKDGEIFAHILNFLRFQKLPPAETALDVHKYAKDLNIQSLVNKTKDYQLVVAEDFLEKVKKLYPTYERFLDEIITITRRRFPVVCRVIVEFIFRMQHIDSNSLRAHIEIRTPPEDYNGECFRRFLQLELKRQGFSIHWSRYRGNTYFIEMGTTDDRLGKIVENTDRLPE